MTEKVTPYEMYEWVDKRLLSDEVSHEFRAARRLVTAPTEPRELEVGAALKELVRIIDLAPDEFRALSARVINRREGRHG